MAGKRYGMDSPFSATNSDQPSPQVVARHHHYPLPSDRESLSRSPPHQWPMQLRMHAALTLATGTAHKVVPPETRNLALRRGEASSLAPRIGHHPACRALSRAEPKLFWHILWGND